MQTAWADEVAVATVLVCVGMFSFAVGWRSPSTTPGVVLGRAILGGLVFATYLAVVGGFGLARALVYAVGSLVVGVGAELGAHYARRRRD